MDIWKILAAIASLVAIITAFAKFVQWLRTPTHKLEVRVGWNSFRLPPQLQTELAAQWAKVTETLKRVEEDIADRNRAPELSRRVNEICREIRYSVEKEVSFELRTLRSAWVATVVNSGKKKCSEVNLQLPHATHAVVKHDRESEGTSFKVNGVVHLGELRPSGECEVIGWTNWPVSNSDYSAVRVSHDSGVGKVRGEWRNDRFTYLLGTITKNAVPGLIMAAIWFTGMVTIPWVIRTVARAQSQGPNALNSSYDQFIQSFNELDGRDREQEEYIDEANQKQISWDVSFERATTAADSVFVSFGADHPNSPVQSGSIALTQRDRMFALHRGDIVHITGRLMKLSSRSLHVSITKLDLVAPAGSPTVTPTPTQAASRER